jgi:hypothetical protein
MTADSGRQSLVLTVVPLDNVGVDASLIAETRELARFPSPLQRTREYERERLARQDGHQQLCRSTTGLSERQIRQSRVPPGTTPLRLAVPDQPDVVRRRAHHDDLSVTSARMTTLLSSRSHRTELATAAHSSQCSSGAPRKRVLGEPDVQTSNHHDAPSYAQANNADCRVPVTAEARQ